MAKVKFGALVQDARGKLAGNTFSRNPYGSYVRAATSPIQPQTARQQAQRSIFTTAAQAWRNLTDAQRAAWGSWAASHPFLDVFGDSRILQAHAAYIQVHAQRVTLGLAAVSDPPALDQTDYGPDPISVAADATTGEITVTLAAAAAANDRYAVWTTRGLSIGVSFAGPELRLAFAGAPGAVASWAFSPTAFNPLLAFATGQKVIAHVIQYTTEGL